MTHFRTPSTIQTLLSVPESRRISRLRGSQTFTAGRESHPAPKTSFSNIILELLYHRYSRMQPHSAANFSNEKAALAGLVEGNLMALMPVSASPYFTYISWDFPPLAKT